MNDSDVRASSNRARISRQLEGARRDGRRLRRTGFLAEREYGVGRLAGTSMKIVAALDGLFERGGKISRGERVIITAGANARAIDPVRFVFERGEQFRPGIELAREALARGAGRRPRARGERGSTRPRDARVATGGERARDVRSHARAGRARPTFDDRERRPLPTLATGRAARSEGEEDTRAGVAGWNSKRKRRYPRGARGERKKRRLSCLGSPQRRRRHHEAYAREKLRGKHLDAIVVNDVSGGARPYGESGKTSWCYFWGEARAQKPLGRDVEAPILARPPLGRNVAPARAQLGRCVLLSNRRRQYRNEARILRGRLPARNSDWPRTIYGAVTTRAGQTAARIRGAVPGALSGIQGVDTGEVLTRHRRFRASCRRTIARYGEACRSLLRSPIRHFSAASRPAVDGRDPPRPNRTRKPTYWPRPSPRAQLYGTPLAHGRLSGRPRPAPGPFSREGELRRRRRCSRRGSSISIDALVGAHRQAAPRSRSRRPTGRWAATPTARCKPGIVYGFVGQTEGMLGDALRAAMVEDARAAVATSRYPPRDRRSPHRVASTSLGGRTWCCLGLRTVL